MVAAKSKARRWRHSSLSRSSSGGSTSSTLHPAASRPAAAASSAADWPGSNSTPGRERTMPARREYAGPTIGTSALRRSSGCGGDKTPRRVRRSSTDRASGPSTDIRWPEMPGSSGGIDGARETLPNPGLSPITPQHRAGFRMDPPMSLPRPNGAIPEPTTEPSPPLDPPAVRSGFHGLRVSPRKALSVDTRSPSSGMFVRPIGIPPAALTRSTVIASRGGKASAKAATPWVVAYPKRSMFSLIVNGTPWSGPSLSPPPAPAPKPGSSCSETARSAASAAANAASAISTVMAFNRGLTSAIRSRCASTTSRLETSLVSMRCARSVAERCHN